MNVCIIADFEWCVTPYPTGDRFQYFNEIVSVGAVRIDEAGKILDRFYALIRPEAPAYLHPVILSALRLSRDALATADPFPLVFERFLAFVGAAPIFTWGCADRSALLQNLRIKAGMRAEAAASAAPIMRDLQPVLSRGAGIPPPYPSLAAVLSALHIKSENRHNALADAEDTAQIVSVLYKNDCSLVVPLFPDAQSLEESLAPKTHKTSPEGTSDAQTASKTPGEALHRIRRAAVSCPVCGVPAGTGTWIRQSPKEMMALCCCEADGRFLCTASALENEDGTFTASCSSTPFDGPQKARYEAARRAARHKRLQNAQKSASGSVQSEKKLDPNGNGHSDTDKISVPSE
ncbi:MAG: hypothetical protein J6S76_08000 [Clostridia bacterium]|nr:hypothetical protein [Clostridia bacterium]